MKTRDMRWFVVGLGLSLGTWTGAEATDGHFLQGVGAVNAAMGGAGTAAPVSLLGTFYLNPAGLMAFDGTRLEASITLQENASDLGSGTGNVTASQTDYRPIPALAISHKLENDRVTLGLAAMGTAGFSVRYPTGSANPVLEPQPDGLGAVSSDYQVMWLAPTIAVEPIDGLWLGGGARLAWASLSLEPMLFAAPINGFYSSGATGDEAFGVGFQAGLLWNVNDFLAVGASYASKVTFDSFVFASTVGDPNSSSFGQGRTLAFDLDVPAVLSGGVGMTPLPGMVLAADIRYVLYEEAAGFELEGSDPVAADGSIEALGWENVLVIAAGLEYALTDAVRVRGGYNHTDNPVPEELMGVNLQAPAIVQDHVGVGLGWRPSRRFEISAGYSHGFEKSLSGPTLVPPALDANVTTTASENAFHLQFAVGTRGF